METHRQIVQIKIVSKRAGCYSIHQAHEVNGDILEAFMCLSFVVLSLAAPIKSKTVYQHIRQFAPEFI